MNNKKPEMTANQVHVFISLPQDPLYADAYKDALQEHGYIVHEVDNLLDLGIEWAHAGKPANAIVMIRDEHLSMHTNQNRLNTLTIKKLISILLPTLPAMHCVWAISFGVPTEQEIRTESEDAPAANAETLAPKKQVITLNSPIALS